MAAPSRRAGLSVVIAASVAGAIAGAAAATLFTSPKAKDRLSGVASPASEASGAEGHWEKRFNALTARLRKLETEQQPAEDDEADEIEATPGVARAPAPRLQSVREQLQLLRQQLSDDYLRDAVDPGWAREASVSFDRDLRSFSQAGGHFELLGVECRGSWCRSRVRFPTYQDSETEAQELLRKPYALNCTRYVVPDERAPDEPPSRPYESTLYMHCGEPAVVTTETL